MVGFGDVRSEKRVTRPRGKIQELPGKCPSSTISSRNRGKTYRREYRSSRRFTIGVPVTAHLLLAFNAQTALAVLLERDLQ